jgi:membrane protease YdiL (CAAX protease family)
VRVGQVATWFAVMWALLLIVTLNLGEDFDIRGQLVINLVIVFLGGSLLFIRRFRLPPREVLSLRMPPASAWPAVVLGVPSALITGIGVFRISQWFVPVPREVLEIFSQYLVPDTIPFWQLLPMMTLLPGICEEIAFRGVLLHSLRRHYSPVMAVLIAGLVFGLFHFSLFRLAPTAYLGVVLGIVTVLSGSIYPAMAWHALNNALGLAAGHYELELDALPAYGYVLAAAGLAVSFWMLWSSRRTSQDERRATSSDQQP